MPASLFSCLENHEIYDAITSYLYPCEAARIVMSCWRTTHGVMPRGRHLILSTLRRSGHCPRYRRSAWAFHVRGDDAKVDTMLKEAKELETRTKFWDSADIVDLRINKLGIHISDHVNFAEMKAVLSLGGEIDRDLLRTMPQHPIFHPPEHSIAPNGTLKPQALPATHGLHCLRRILQLFALTQPHVCYCQGMNYVAANVFLFVAGATTSTDVPVLSAYKTAETSVTCDELVHATTRILIGMATHMGLADVWRPGLPRLRSLAWQLSHFIKQHTPRLHEHLAAIGFHYEILAAQWLLTLMSTVVPMHTLGRLWDLFFVHGWKILFKSIVCCLQVVQNRLCDMDIGEISTFFRLWKDGVACASANDAAASRLLEEAPEFWILWDSNEFISRVLSIKITRRMLHESESKYVEHVLRKSAAEMPRKRGVLVDSEQQHVMKATAPILVPMLLHTKNSPLLNTKLYKSYRGSRKRGKLGIAANPSSSSMVNNSINNNTARMITAAVRATPHASPSSRSVLPSGGTPSKPATSTSHAHSFASSTSMDRLSLLFSTASPQANAFSVHTPRSPAGKALSSHPLLSASSATASVPQTVAPGTLHSEIASSTSTTAATLPAIQPTMGSSHVEDWLPGESPEAQEPYMTSSTLLTYLEGDVDVSSFHGMTLPDCAWPCSPRPIPAAAVADYDARLELLLHSESLPPSPPNDHVHHADSSHHIMHQHSYDHTHRLRAPSTTSSSASALKNGFSFVVTQDADTSVKKLAATMFQTPGKIVRKRVNSVVSVGPHSVAPSACKVSPRDLPTSPKYHAIEAEPEETGRYRAGGTMERRTSSLSRRSSTVSSSRGGVITPIPDDFETAAPVTPPKPYEPALAPPPSSISPPVPPMSPSKPSEPYCPTRLDTDPMFGDLVRLFEADIHTIDEALRADAVALNEKIAQTKHGIVSANHAVEVLRADSKALEKLTMDLLASKQTAADGLHAKLTTTHTAEPKKAAKALGDAGSALAALDVQIKETAAKWKKALWAENMAATRLSELQSARDALMAQLIHVTNRAEADKSLLAQQLWYALSRAWLKKRGRIHNAQLDMKYGR